MKTDKTEFYVGYEGQAPRGVARMMMKVILAIGVLVVLVSVTLVVYQKPFASTRFEYGTTTALEGYLFTTPIPHLIVPLGGVENHPLVQHVLLVGFGKSGANAVIDTLEQKVGHALNGNKVTLKGTLIYGDGKVVMQITAALNETMPAAPDTTVTMQNWISDGHQTVYGEIVDPKCYFGVMKPGEGKTHRSCAVRCIAGGIPPVFHAGSGEYYYLLDENARPINTDLLALVGDQIALSGEAMTWNDWKVLKLNINDVKNMGYTKQLKQTLIAFERGITQCR